MGTRLLLCALSVWLALPGAVWAADGDSCTSTVTTAYNTAGRPTLNNFSCVKLCDGHGDGALNCGSPIRVPFPHALVTEFRVEVHDDCDYDSIQIGQFTTSTTTGIAAKGIATLDDDATASDGTTGVTTIRIERAVGPWVQVLGGTLGTCAGTAFSVWMLQWNTPLP